MSKRQPDRKHRATHRRCVRLVRRPGRAPQITDFAVVTEDMPPLGEGDALVEAVFLSIDPTLRLWLSDRLQYAQPVGLGEVVRGFGIGRVISSKLEMWPVGLMVAGLLGWSSHRVVTSDEALSFAPLPDLPADSLPSMLNVLGPSGVAAFHGVYDVAKLQRAETIIVTSAAGAVGSIAGQLAKREGCRVIGIAGGPQKCAWLRQIGFDAAIDRHQPDWKDQLMRDAPGGADVLFENVGGDVMAGAVACLKRGGRIALCGMVGRYNDEGPMLADWAPVLMRSLCVRGFQISDLAPDTWARAQTALSRLKASGELHHRELIVDGLDGAPAALHALLAGDHYGKVIVRAAHEADSDRHPAATHGDRPEGRHPDICSTVRS